MRLFAKLKHLATGMMSCRQANDFLAAYIEGVLPAKTRAQFESHMAACKHCETFLQQYLQTIALVKETDAVAPPPELVQHTLAFLRKNWDA